MKTYYILGVNNFCKLPIPKDFDLIEVEAEDLNEAIKLASKNSDKRYFCSLKLKSLSREDFK